MPTVLKSFYTWYQKTLEHPQYRWIVIVASLIYLISPVDISPDFLPILGWIDDGVVASMLVTSLAQLLLSQRDRRRRDLKSEVSADSQTTVDVMPK
ncbi:MAG: DUF1232 domain-containing protein [Cyanobacteria bacterium REEB459]|nr:DUF1232 domain-containing protein [Cyanobacteria bacterium REEB459]